MKYKIYPFDSDSVLVRFDNGIPEKFDAVNFGRKIISEILKQLNSNISANDINKINFSICSLGNNTLLISFNRRKIEILGGVIQAYKALNNFHTLLYYYMNQIKSSKEVSEIIRMLVASNTLMTETMEITVNEDVENLEVYNMQLENFSLLVNDALDFAASYHYARKNYTEPNESYKLNENYDEFLESFIEAMEDDEKLVSPYELFDSYFDFECPKFLTDYEESGLSLDNNEIKEKDDDVICIEDFLQQELQENIQEQNNKKNPKKKSKKKDIRKIKSIFTGSLNDILNARDNGYHGELFKDSNGIYYFSTEIEEKKLSKLYDMLDIYMDGNMVHQNKIVNFERNNEKIGKI